MNTTPYIEHVAAFAGAGGGAGIGFFAIKWFAEWFSGRSDKREARLDATSDKLNDLLERRIETLTDRLDTIESLLADCQRMHAKSEADVMRLTAIVEAQGEIRQRAAGVVALDRLSQAASKMEGDNNA